MTPTVNDAVGSVWAVWMRRLQCKDISATPILEAIWDVNQNLRRWGTWCDGLDNSIADAFPVGTPHKLLLAKMRKLFAQGLVTGCDCGCRGDYVITEKGAALIGRPPQTGCVGY